MEPLLEIESRRSAILSLALVLKSLALVINCLTSLRKYAAPLRKIVNFSACPRSSSWTTLSPLTEIAMSKLLHSLRCATSTWCEKKQFIQSLTKWSYEVNRVTTLDSYGHLLPSLSLFKMLFALLAPLSWLHGELIKVLPTKSCHPPISRQMMWLLLFNWLPTLTVSPPTRKPILPLLQL